MTRQQPENPVANTNEGDEANSTAEQRFEDGLRALAERARELGVRDETGSTTKQGFDGEDWVRILVDHAREHGVVENLAAILRDSPLEAELAARDLAFEMGSLIAAAALKQLDSDGKAVEADERT